MSDLTLEGAYETAFAVFSPRVRFVEWKMFEVPSDNPRSWCPYWRYRGERLWDTWKEIDSKRWIYAFRRPTGQGGAAVLAGEFFLDADKQLYATPMAEMRARADASRDVWPERGKHSAKIPSQRPALVPIGTTVSFIRQFKGNPLEHFFFSSRVQLPSNIINELQKHIMDWTPAITFKPYDPNIVPGSEAEAKPPGVPVLDPITIATHLHAYYLAATDDEIKYRTPAEDKGDPRSEDDKEKATGRQKKFLLACIIDSIIENDGKLRGICDQGQLKDFLDQYKEQVQFRIDWRKRWVTFLVNWLRARPITLLYDAHVFDEAEDIPEFLLHMAHCHFRLSDCPEGRDLLAEHFAAPQKFPWVYKYFFGKSFMGLSPNLQQSIRRLGSAPLEFLKEHAPVAFMAVGKLKMPAAKHLIQEALTEMYGVEINPVLIICGKQERGWFFSLQHDEHKTTAKMRVRGDYGEGTVRSTTGVGKGETKFIERHEADLLKQGKEVDEILEHNPRGMKPSWKGALGSVVEFIEIYNFVVALSSLGDAEPKEKVTAFLELTEAGIHLTHATLELQNELKIFGKTSEKTLSKLAFVSAAIDVYLGAKETIESLSEGKFGKAIGSGIVTFGAGIIAVGVFFEVGLAGPVGMAIMGIGYFIDYIFRDPTEYENFIYYSAFGKPGVDGNWDKNEEPTWYKTEKKFKDWASDYDEQIRAAIMLLCRFRIERPSIPLGYQTGWHDDAWVAQQERNYLTANVEMGWVPKGSKLHLKLSELWEKASDSKEFTADLEFTIEDDKEDGKPGKPSVSVLASNGLSVKPLEGGQTLVVTAQRSGKPLFDTGNDVVHGQRFFLGTNKELKNITLTGSLEVTLEKGIAARPVKDCVLYGKPVSPPGTENEPGEITGGR